MFKWHIRLGEINLKRSISLTSHSSSTMLHAKLQAISLPDPSPQGILTDCQIQSTSAGTALNIPTYVTSLCSSIFPRFSQPNPLAHPCHLLWAPHSPFIRFITFAVICFICLPIWMKIPGQQGLSPLYPPGPNRLNWHTVGASEVHTHLHAFAHAAPSASNACTPISACWTQSCPSKLRSNPNPLWEPPCHCSFQFLPDLQPCRNHLCTGVVFLPCPSPTVSSWKAGAVPGAWHSVSTLGLR